METKTGAALGSWIGSCGLRTTRQRRRALCRQREKSLRSIGRERQHISWAQRALPMVPLDPPVQKGWIRSFELREDQRQLETADFYTSILSKINTVLWSSRPDFKVRRRYRGRKFYVVRPQSLKELSVWDFSKGTLTDDERALFDADYRLDQWGRFRLVYVFREPWRFSLRTAPNIIDKIRVRDAELDSREQQVENYLTRHALKGPLSNLLGRRHQYRAWRPDKPDVNPLRNRSVAQVLTALRAEEF